MPEVIEVKEYTDFCNKYIKNKKLLNIKILNGRYKKHSPFNGFKELLKTLPLKVVETKNKGKFMYIQLRKEESIYIGITLGLSGGWFFNPKKLKKDTYIHGLNGSRYIETDIEKYKESALKHLNVEFVFENGSLYFYDQLSFGTISIFNSLEIEKKLKTIGLDIMDLNTSFDMFQNALLHKTNLNKEIGNALMNQKYISGIGNYLRADALWLSKINPFIKVKSLSNNDVKKIYHNVRLLIWGQYNKKLGIQYGIINKSDKLPIDYNRNFFVYQQETDIYGKQVFKEKLYEGSQIRYIFYTKLGT
jgi:formamidopyrimidine-DNA glycosylase